MSTIGQFSAKNPTVKRILKEASELSNSPSPDYTAAPIETNMFEWHFTIRGPPAPSPFQGGLYHGRIILPPTYPLRPPSFRFLTPSGRFEVNREICLSISGFHEETWQPAWGIRTALIAIRSFMDTDAQGNMGGLTQPDETRRKLARESVSWRCTGCTGKTCAEMISEVENATKTDESVPDELRLGYRDELDKKSPGSSSSSPPGPSSDPCKPPIRVGSSSAQSVAALPRPTPTIPQARRLLPSLDTPLIDGAIAVVAFALTYFVVQLYL